MIGEADIRELIATYLKYGWELRQVRLTKATRERLQQAIEDLFGIVLIQPSDDVDSAWFARSSSAGRTSLEIRHLDPNPYALLIVIDEDADARTLMAATEEKLAQAIRRQPVGH